MAGHITTGLMSSNTDNWATPQHIFDRLKEEFGFTLDVCASDENHKCDKYFTKEDDGLNQDWSKDICWMNPPYGKTIGQWVKKAKETAAQGTIVVALLPARTDTKWWWDHCMYATEVRFIKGRLKFGGSNTSAPFPSVIVIWNGVSNGYPFMCGMDNEGNDI